LQVALIAVVKQEDIQRSGRGSADNVRIVLGAEPIYGIDRVGGTGLKSKVALEPSFQSIEPSPAPSL
jgi:hypothetical protein